MKKYIISLLLFSFMLSQDETFDPVFTGTFGSATINNEIYNQFSIRPEFTAGNLGVGFDLYFYFDENGALYDRNWDFSSGETMRTLIDKIYYIRWNQPFDDRYFRIGSLPKVTMGYGSLVNSYSNSMDYPSIRRTGFDLRFTFGNFGLDFIHSDFKEFDAPALLGLGTRFEFIENLDLSFIMVTDQNQYNGLLDSDGDHYPDYVEPDYADDPDRWHDNQFITEFLLNSDCVAVICIDLINNADESETPDGICDNCDDLNSDAICDNDLNENLIIDGVCQSLYDDALDDISNPFNIDANADNVSGITFGAGYNVSDNITLYFELSQLLGETSNPYSGFSSCTDEKDNDSGADEPDGICDNEFDQIMIDKYENFDNDLKLGYGIIPLGVKFEWNNVSLSFDYRRSSRNFLFSYWDQNYDHNRSMVVTGADGVNRAFTKESQLYNYGESEGIQFMLSSNLFRFLNFSMTYQNLNTKKFNNNIIAWAEDTNPDLAEEPNDEFIKERNNTLYTKLDIDTSRLPQVQIAEIFYQKSHSEKVFNLDPDENTLFGYNVGLEIADNVVFILKGRKSYIKNEKSNDNFEYEPVKTTQFETQIIF